MNFQQPFRRFLEPDPAGGRTPVTSREVLERGRQWAESGGDSEFLLGQVAALRNLARQSLQDTVKDLEENRILDPELHEALEASRDGFFQMEQTLQALQEALEAQDRESAVGFLASFEAAARLVGEAGRAMSAWLEAPVLRCPRCGTEGVSECAECGLHLLIPDPGRPRDRSLKVAMLPLPFGPVYQAYAAVVSGSGRLEPLYDSLELLESEMRTRRRHAEFYGRLMGSEAADRLLTTVDEVLDGIHRMRQGADMRVTQELNAGWDLIFGAGEQVLERTAGVLDEAGGDPSSASHRGSDSVFLRGA